MSGSRRLRLLSASEQAVYLPYAKTKVFHLSRNEKTLSEIARNNWIEGMGYFMNNIKNKRKWWHNSIFGSVYHDRPKMYKTLKLLRDRCGLSSVSIRGKCPLTLLSLYKLGCISDAYEKSEINNLFENFASYGCPKSLCLLRRWGAWENKVGSELDRVPFVRAAMNGKIKAIKLMKRWWMQSTHRDTFCDAVYVALKLAVNKGLTKTVRILTSWEGGAIMLSHIESIGKTGNVRALRMLIKIKHPGLVYALITALEAGRENILKTLDKWKFGLRISDEDPFIDHTKSEKALNEIRTWVNRPLTNH